MTTRTEKVPLDYQTLENCLTLAETLWTSLSASLDRDRDLLLCRLRHRLCYLCSMHPGCSLERMQTLLHFQHQLQLRIQYLDPDSMSSPPLSLFRVQ